MLAGPLLLTGCGSPDAGSAPSATTAPPAGARTFATLDKAGIESIKASKIARLDMTTGWLAKESVGLEDGSRQAPDVRIPDGTMDLIIEGPRGVVTARTDRLRLNGMNTGSNFSEVTYFLTARSLEDYAGLIRDGVHRHGIDEESSDDWIQAVSALPSQKSDFAVGTGTQVGLQVTCDLRYDGSKETQVMTVQVNPLPVRN